MKRNDFILIGVITVLCILSIILFNTVSKEGSYVVIKIDNSVTGTYPLNEDAVIRIPKAGNNYNIVEIRDKQVFVNDADCPDLICKKHAPISKTGESIICLPHKLSIIITNDTSNENTDFDAVSE